MLLDDEDLALELVAAGFDSPAKVKAATDKELEGIPGIGKATVKRIRERFPARK